LRKSPEGEPSIVAAEPRRSRLDRHLAAYNFPFTNGDMIMEADQINVIANTLADIAQRTAELRRYL